MLSKFKALRSRSSLGMSVLELLLAVTMMMVFTGVVAAVMEVTLRFMGEAECPIDVVSGQRLCNDASTQDAANGVIIDRQRIEMLFDQLERVLVQPGIHRSQIESISANSNNPQACTTNSSTFEWQLKIPELPVLIFPRGYHVCLWQLGTTREALIDDLVKLPVTTDPIVVPRLYVLQALPARLSAATLPVRRLICRPRPFC